MNNKKVPDDSFFSYNPRKNHLSLRMTPGGIKKAHFRSNINWFMSKFVSASNMLYWNQQ